MYDESYEITNAVEIKTPSSSDSEDLEMARRFNPPRMHHINSDDSDTLDSDSIMSGALRKIDSAKSVSRPKSASKSATDRTKHVESFSSEDSGSESIQSPVPQIDASSEGGVQKPGIWPAQGSFDFKKHPKLKLTSELETIVQFIEKYTPQEIEIETRLEPFVPEYIPAVGDVDPFVKLRLPTRDIDGSELDDDVLEFVDGLGMTVLDEPKAIQSDPILLNLQLMAKTKTSSSQASVITKKLENPETNSKAIDRWIRDISELHVSSQAPNVDYRGKMPELDTLLEEWPENVEETLNNVGFPPSTVQCNLIEYVDLICGLFDIPIMEDTLNARIEALHLLFTLYDAVKKSQIYAERLQLVPSAPPEHAVNE